MNLSFLFLVIILALKCRCCSVDILGLVLPPFIWEHAHFVSINYYIRLLESMSPLTLPCSNFHWITPFYISHAPNCHRNGWIIRSCFGHNLPSVLLPNLIEAARMVTYPVVRFLCCHKATDLLHGTTKTATLLPAFSTYHARESSQKSDFTLSAASEW